MIVKLANVMFDPNAKKPAIPGKSKKGGKIDVLKTLGKVAMNAQEQFMGGSKDEL